MSSYNTFENYCKANILPKIPVITKKLQNLNHYFFISKNMAITDYKNEHLLLELKETFNKWVELLRSKFKGST